MYRYECALILNKKRNIYVLPVFVGDESEGRFERFSISKTGGFPDLPHHRGPDANQIVNSLR